MGLKKSPLKRPQSAPPKSPPNLPMTGLDRVRMARGMVGWGRYAERKVLGGWRSWGLET